MNIVINESTSIKPLPTITLNKSIKDYNNDWGYNMGKYNYQKLSKYSLLLSDEVEDKDVVKGVVEIEESNAPENVLLSSLKGIDLNFENVVQFEITNIDIPQCWITKDALKEMFIWLQHYLRGDFNGKKVVIVWFEYDKYYLCPVATNIYNDEYKHFAPSAASLFSKILENKL